MFHINIFEYIVIRPKTIVETDPVLRETETESDCLADRSAALDEQKAHLVREQQLFEMFNIGS